jgi:DNA-directed RNA polymerase specialized sigma24 family protein
MSDLVPIPSVPIPSDHELVEQTRRGSVAAWDEVQARHVDAIRLLARSRERRQGRRRTEAVFVQLRTDLTGSESAGSDSGAHTMPIRPNAIGILTGGSYGPVWNDHTRDDHTRDDETHDVPGVDQAGETDGAQRRELYDVAAAFGRLPTAWQAVLWHRWVEHAAAAELTAILGRRPSDVVALERTARRGLADAYAEVVLAGTPPPDPLCVRNISQLGAYRRGTLSDVQRRAVDAHVGGSSQIAPCDACRRRLDVVGALAVVVPVAIVPGLTGLTADRYRAVIGAGGLAVGASALAARRAHVGRQLARVGAVAAVVLALLAAALFVREPFGDLDSQIADLLDRTTTTVPDPSNTTPTTTPTVPPEDPRLSANGLPNRIEIVFPGALQGAVYVPGGRAPNVAISLSAPAPIYAGATGTIDADITNNDTEDAVVRFIVRSSPGVSFDRLSGGLGSCRADQTAGAGCTLSLPAGSTGTMSLQFRFAADVSDRLVVAPSIRSPALEVPVEFVPGLLVGEVGRGDLRMVGATLGTCDVLPTCSNGRRDASSAVLDLPAGAVVQRALLVWEGDRSDAPWADAVGLIPPGSSSASTVSAGIGEALGGVVATGSGVATSDTEGATGFRSIADVTELVGDAGGGTYTVVRPPSPDAADDADAAGDGSWTLIVITQAPPGDPTPRRLFVVIRPDQGITVNDPLRVDVPIDGSDRPDAPLRLVSLTLQAATTGTGVSQVTVQEGRVTAEAAFAEIGPDGGTATYDQQIASTEDVLSLVASTTADELRLSSIGLSADIDS